MHINPLQMVPLSELATFEMGQSPPSRYVNDLGIGVPFLQGNAEFGTSTPVHKYSCTQPSKLCEPDDILISVRAPVGDLNKADQVYCIGRGLAAIRCHSMLPQFGWHLLQYWSKDLQRMAQGSTFLAISKSHLTRLQVPYFPAEEQRRIADILDTADAAIRETEAVIAKLKQVKAGLLHDLLMRGLDENGRLRDPQRHPEQFKDTAIGRVPREWEESTLLELAVHGISNGVFKKPQLVGSGYPLVNVLDLYQDFGIDLDKVERLNISVEDQKRYAVEPGDCFFTRSSLNVTGIAHCNVILDVPEPAVYEAHIMRVRPDQTRVLPAFFAHWCRAPWSRQFFMSRAKHTTMTTIAQPDIAPLPIFLPSLSEQVQIVEILDSCAERISTEEAYRNKLQEIKRGLMQDLLTGSVRV